MLYVNHYSLCRDIEQHTCVDIIIVQIVDLLNDINSFTSICIRHICLSYGP